MYAIRFNYQDHDNERKWFTGDGWSNDLSKALKYKRLADLYSTAHDYKEWLYKATHTEVVEIKEVPATYEVVRVLT